MVGARSGIFLLVILLLIAGSASATEGMSSWPMQNHDLQGSSSTDVYVDAKDLRIIRERSASIQDAIVLSNGDVLARTDYNSYVIMDEGLLFKNSLYYLNQSSGYPYFFHPVGPATIGTNGRIFAGYINDTSSALVCYNGEYEQLWVIEIVGALTGKLAFLDSNELLVVCADSIARENGTVSNITAMWISVDGQVLARMKIADSAPANNVAFAVGTDGSVLILLPGVINDTLVKIGVGHSIGWTVNIPRTYEEASAIGGLHVDGSGRIIAHDRGRLLCYSPLGELLWTYGRDIISLAIKNDHIFALNATSFITAIDSEGMGVWGFQGLGGASASNVIVTGDGSVLFSTSDHLYALSSEAGTVLSDVVLASTDFPFPVSGSAKNLIPREDGSILVLWHHYGNRLQLVGGPQDVSRYQVLSLATLSGLLVAIMAIIIIAYRAAKFWTISGDGHWISSSRAFSWLVGRAAVVRAAGMLLIVLSLMLTWFFYSEMTPGFFIDPSGYATLLNRPLTDSSLISLVGAWALLLFLLASAEYWWGGVLALASIVLISTDISMFWTLSWLPFVNDMRNGLEFGWGFAMAIWGAALVMVSGFIPKKYNWEKSEI